VQSRKTPALTFNKVHLKDPLTASMFKNAVSNNLSSIEPTESLDGEADRINRAFIDAGKITVPSSH
jgi:hypothetical protein